MAPRHARDRTHAKMPVAQHSRPALTRRARPNRHAAREHRRVRTLRPAQCIRPAKAHRPAARRSRLVSDHRRVRVPQPARVRTHVNRPLRRRGPTRHAEINPRAMSPCRAMGQSHAPPVQVATVDTRARGQFPATIPFHAMELRVAQVHPRANTRARTTSADIRRCEGTTPAAKPPARLISRRQVVPVAGCVRRTRATTPAQPDRASRWMGLLVAQTALLASHGPGITRAMSGLAMFRHSRRTRRTRLVVRVSA